MQSAIFRLDERIIAFMHTHGTAILRISLGVVFFWFGALKLLGVSPVTAIIGTSYSLFPSESFITILGVWELLIGIGLISKVFLRTTLLLLWLQMAGTLLSFLWAPSLFFFQGNPFFLTVEGEFVLKNIVLIAVSLVIGVYEIKKSEFRNSNLETNSNA